VSRGHAKAAKELCKLLHTLARYKKTALLKQDGFERYIPKTT